MLWRRPSGMRGERGREVEASAREGKGDQRRESGRERREGTPQGRPGDTVFRIQGPTTAHFREYPNRWKGLEFGAVETFGKKVR